MQFDGEIVSCDSVAVYRGLEIGSAKPSAEQREVVPHHLLDVVAPDAFYTAGNYAREARAAIADITGRGKLPIVAGGTGLYLRALLQGLFSGPQRSTALRERLLRRAETRGPAGLHRILRRLDAASAARIHANDVAKVIRAIEVTLAGSRPMSEAWKQGREALSGYRILRVGLDPERTALYERINARARGMFAEGLVEETRDLIARYGRPPALASLGYRQAALYLGGGLTLEQAIAAASQGHRNYAKRQLTWFRREPDVCWLHGFGDDPDVHAEAEHLVARAKG
jgi:tRNA dimethylallyltransferase